MSANGSLLLRYVSEADDGLYQAFARTPVSEISSPPVQLHVVGQLNFSLSRYTTTILRPPKNNQPRY